MIEPREWSLLTVVATTASYLNSRQRYQRLVLELITAAALTQAQRQLSHSHALRRRTPASHALRRHTPASHALRRRIPASHALRRHTPASHALRRHTPASHGFSSHTSLAFMPQNSYIKHISPGRKASGIYSTRHILFIETPLLHILFDAQAAQ